MCSTEKAAADFSAAAFSLSMCKRLLTAALFSG